MRNHRDNIKNEIAYFNKVVQNMNNKDLGKYIKINEFEKLSNEVEEIYYKSDEYFNGNNLLDWIELIENADLHRALKNLSIEEQTLISYIFYKEKTQSEVAKIYNMSQPAIFQKLNNIINKIKLFMSKK